MKTAFAYYGERMAPVFDTAERLLVVDSDEGRLLSQAHETLPGDDPLRKIERLVELGVETLVCGAVTREMQERLTARGIRFIPFVAGELETIVHAWRDDRLDEPVFAMPGCGRRWRNRCGGRGGGPGGGGRGGGGGRMRRRDNAPG